MAGRTANEIAETLGCARSHIYRITGRYSTEGWGALIDRRATNGDLKADELYRKTVKALVAQSPRDYGYERPTWTRELLVIVAEEQTAILVSLAVMSRVLSDIGARRGRPKPIVKSTVSDRQKRRRLQRIRELIETVAADEVVVYEDEVDIHLNPKIGLDWMNRGQQKTVLTPGKNAKAYVAGALDAQTGELVWVGDGVKNSSLFVALLEKLEKNYSKAKCIHIILDNYGIHKSKETLKALKRLPRIKLHFLPPYCPDDNRIERLWEDLHANVTRNHKFKTLIELCAAVTRFLDAISPWIPGRGPVLLKIPSGRKRAAS
jgi:transposase